MANEEKDELFQTNLGDGLIEIPEEPEKKVEDTTTKAEDKTDKTDKTDKNESVFTQNEDGTIEIDEHLQATIAAAQKKTSEEEDGTDIDKTDKPNEKEKASSESDASSDSSPSSSPYLAFARDRASEGIFLDFGKKDWETLVERNEGDEAAALRELSSLSMQEMVKSGIEQYKGSLTDEDRALYEAKDKGIPVDAYGVAKRNLDEYSKIKLEDVKENVELQEKLVSKVLELRDFTADEIKEEIEGYKTLEVLEKKAENALPMIPKVYKNQIDDLESKAEADQQSTKDNIRQGVAKMKQKIDTTPEIIPGIALTKIARDRIMKSMTEPVAKDANGNALNPVMHTRSKNPDGFEMMLHYYHALGLFNIDEDGIMKPDFSKISKAAKVEATDELKNIFETKEKNVSGKTKTVKTQDDELDDFEKAFGRL